MRGSLLFLSILVGAALSVGAQTPTAAPQAEASAEVKAGLGVEKSALTGEAKTFPVTPDTKIYIWTKVAGCADTKISITFEKAGKVVATRELPVPRSPYRTNAYKTFRAGDDGEWTSKVLSADGKELGSVSYTVTIQK